MFKRLKIMAACALTFFSAHAYAQDTNNTDTAENAASASAENTAPEAEAAAGNTETAQATVMTGGDIALPDDTAAPADAAPADAAEPEIMTDALLDKRLREVSTHVDTLKEDTFTTKSRLLLLREEVLQRSVSGARLQIRHKNDMGGQYELVQVYYALDNEPVFSKQDMTGELDDLDDEIISKNEDIVVYKQNIKSCEKPLEELEDVDNKCPVCQSDISSYKKKELIKDYNSQISENEKLISVNEENVRLLLRQFVLVNNLIHNILSYQVVVHRL